MNQLSILFFNEDIKFELKQKRELRKWILETIENEVYTINSLNFIFCSDAYLLNINQQYLNHDTYTDIITFDNSETEKKILGDIFISVERVKENAKKMKIPFCDELNRVMIHGVLHLLGYTDKNKTQKEAMTAKEDFYLKKS